MAKSSSRKAGRKAHSHGARAGRGGSFEGERPPVGDWRVRPLPEPFDDEQLARLHARGLNAREIAEQLGTTYGRTRQYLRAQGLERHIRQKHRTAPHGLHLYSVWFMHRSRCARAARARATRPSARAIRFAWHDDFDGFYEWSMLAGYAPGLCLDRFDPERDYEPRNCRWVERRAILDRRPRQAHSLIAAFGERKSITEWQRDPRCRIDRASLSHRIYRGYPPEQAISLPAGEPPTHYVTPPKKPEWMRKRGHIDWDEAVRLYTREKRKLTEIARRFGASHATIHEGLRSRGIELRKPSLHTTRASSLALSKTWSRLRRLSADPKSPEYRGPNRVGELLCRAWQTFEGFAAWAAPRRTLARSCLVRKDASKPYSPANCEWVAASNVKHRMPGTARPVAAVRLLTAFGETKGIAAWARDPRARVSIHSISKRLERGMTIEDAISLPGRVGDYGAPRISVTAFGITKSPAEWLRDPRCKLISMAGLLHRLERGWPAEEAIATPAFVEPKGRRGSRAR